MDNHLIDPFKMDSAVRNPEAAPHNNKEEVEGLAAALKEHPDSRIQVQVHTADGKDKAANKNISKLRAKVVKDMLVTLGVNADQISSKGLGLTTEDAAKAVANT